MQIWRSSPTRRSLAALPRSTPDGARRFLLLAATGIPYAALKVAFAGRGSTHEALQKEVRQRNRGAASTRPTLAPTSRPRVHHFRPGAARIACLGASVDEAQGSPDCRRSV